MVSFLLNVSLSFVYRSSYQQDYYLSPMQIKLFDFLLTRYLGITVFHFCRFLERVACDESPSEIKTPLMSFEHIRSCEKQLSSLEWVFVVMQGFNYRVVIFLLSIIFITIQDLRLETDKLSLYQGDTYSFTTK